MRIRLVKERTIWGTTERSAEFDVPYEIADFVSKFPSTMSFELVALRKVPHDEDSS